MYIRRTKRTRKDKTYYSYLLVESVWTEKGPRQRTIVSLGDLRPRRREEWLKLAHKVEAALVGQGDLGLEEPDAEVDAIVAKVRARESRHKADGSGLDQEVVGVLVDQVETEKPREAGPVHVGHQMWNRLAMDDHLTSAGLSERTRRLTEVMVLNRVIEPCSEHAMPSWVRRTALNDILGEDFESLTEDSLYRTMDRLYPVREVIEKSLVGHEKDLFGLDDMVYFYDLTSTYFEGQCKRNSKAKRGYSRDKRPDCSQVLLGLVVNRHGFPKAHQIFDGNLKDHQTVENMLDTLESRVGKQPGRLIVIDRGMAYDETLDSIRQRGCDFLVACRQKDRDDWLDEFEELDGWEVVERHSSPRNRYEKKSEVRIKRHECEELTYLLCWSEGRQAKDRAIREKHEHRLLSDLEKLRKRIASGRLKRDGKIFEAIGRLKERYPRVARYYAIEFSPEDSELTWKERTVLKQRTEELDGSYMMKTSRKNMEADDIWRTYMLLSRAENAFQDIKGPLAERPIFHQKEQRVDTHIFLCLIAYHFLVSIEKAFFDRDLHTSWKSIRDTLKTHQVATAVLPLESGETLRIRKTSKAEPPHKEIYDVLSIPYEVISPQKTLTPPSHSD